MNASPSPVPSAAPVAVANSVDVVALDETGTVLDPNRWSELVREVLVSEAGPEPGEVNITFVDRATIAELNEAHLGVVGPTDVLSFPLDGVDPDGVGTDGVGTDGTDGPGPRSYGDIVLCPEIAEANAPTHAGNLDDEVAVLLVHGVLHLLGHDHAAEDDRQAMWDAERRLLAAHWRPLATDPWTSRR